MSSSASLLEVESLTVKLPIEGELRAVLHGVSLEIRAGESVGLVGESGSGKSMTALSIMQLLPQGSTNSGSITLDGADLLQKSERELCAVRGRDMGMVFQEPMTALDPVYTIGAQIVETVMRHKGCGRTEARARALELLELVKRGRKWNEEAARKHLVTLFEAMGPTDQRTIDARRKLSSILFS